MSELSWYERAKKWGVEHKKEIYVGACFVVVFFIGFGTGRFDKNQNSVKAKQQANYSKNPSANQKTVTEAKAPAVKGETVLQNRAVATTTPTLECKIKGNIGSGGKMIYHMPGGASYKVTKPEMCFNTEEEAVKAGFVKAAR